MLRIVPRIIGLGFVCSTLSLVAAGGQTLKREDTPNTPLPAIIELDNQDVPMRDGVRLRADIFVPPGSGKWPAVLVRTPYNRRTEFSRGYRWFAEHGYAVVLQDVRGRGESEGWFGSIAQEGPDGNDTIDWIVHQPWSNGRVGMAGASYVGMVQWWAAIQSNPHLVAIFPLVSGDDEYLDRYYSPGGALKLGHRLVWLSENLTPRGLRKPPFDSYIRHLPLKSSDVPATTLKLDMWRAPLQHPSYDAFWTRVSIRRHLSEVHVPVASFGGWFDNYVEGDLHAFSVLSRRGTPIETTIGPWSHSFAARYPTIDFGPTALAHPRLAQLAWFDRYLKRARTERPPAPLLRIFVMGAGIWREEHEWPLARTRWTPYFLASQGEANSLSGNGTLSTAPSEGATHDRFTYDPMNPVPTTGGAICCNPRLLPPGPLDQTEPEQRRDVLVYTSDPVREDTEVTGPISATLYVSTSANDTDFSVKLVDVFPNGRPLLVTDGLLRLRYRLSLLTPVFVARNTPYQIRIDAGVTSWLFAAGHRIRVEVSSSNFPRFDRNLNTSRPNNEEFKATRAFQTVYHSRKYPSMLVLPVIPRMRNSPPVRYSHSRVHSNLPGVQ